MARVVKEYTESTHKIEVMWRDDLRRVRGRSGRTLKHVDSGDSRARPEKREGLDIVAEMLPIISLSLARRLGDKRAGQVHVAPLLSPEECSSLINIAEEHDKWGAREGPEQRHRHYSTKDVEAGGRRLMAQPLRDLPNGTARLERLWREHVGPMLCGCFDISAQHLWPADVFIIKYDASPGSTARRSVATHKDSSVISFNILLSPTGDFTGGGTQFTCLPPPPLLPSQGECLAHLGQLPHSGEEITSGRRYILVGFCIVRSPEAAALFGRLQSEGAREGELMEVAAYFAGLQGIVVCHNDELDESDDEVGG